MATPQRFYVKNLPGNAQEDSVKKFFKSVGEIDDVVIKNGYGFFSITSPSEKSINLLQKFSKKWDGQLVSVTLAKKDNFLARLEKEREIAKKEEVIQINKKETLATPVFSHSKRKKTKYRNSESDESSDEEQEKAGIPKFRGTKTLTPQKDDEPDTMQQLAEFDPMWADKEPVDNTGFSKFLQKGSKKDATKNPSKQTQKHKEPKAIPLTKLEKKQKDDERRRSSLADKAKEKRRQQNLVRSSLSQLDDTLKPTKIVFDSDDDEDNSAEAKTALFDDEAQEDFLLPEKSHFEGKDGRQLLELQSKFCNDDRFKMDERFLEEKSAEQNKEREATRPSEMVRFDPNAIAISEQKQEEFIIAKNKPKVETIPVVSKEKFYEVSVNMKSALREKGAGFSLLAAYGGEREEMMAAETPYMVVTKTQSRKNPMLMDDSSGSEEEAAAPLAPASLVSHPAIKLSSGESFFFAENDPLFAEAMDFITKKNSEEAKKYAENFDTTRQVLRRIFKDQSLRRSKKNDLFKKKIGGMKRPAGRSFSRTNFKGPNKRYSR